jgi:hypothetical protein
MSYQKSMSDPAKRDGIPTYEQYLFRLSIRLSSNGREGYLFDRVLLLCTLSGNRIHPVPQAAMMREQQLDRARGALIGSALGDTIGLYTGESTT